MVSFDTGATLAERFRAHAGDRGSLYSHAMRAMADDWEVGGVVREVCRGWEDAPAGSVVQLRLLAGVFREVLRGSAPELIPYYPCLGGTAQPAEAWPTMRDIMARIAPRLHAELAIDPQTNEVGRSCALLVGLFDAVRRTGLRRLRVLEPGASAGLNLNVDRYRFDGEDWSYGDVASPLVLRPGAPGARPEAFEVIERRGCDLHPVDPADPEGALWLRSFIWPWHVERHERFEAALRIAAGHPVPVDRASAGEWLDGQLVDAPGADVLTVVWQSVTRMYWPAEEVDRVDAVITAARERMPLVHVAMEHETWQGETTAVVRLDGIPLALAGDHGPPVTLL